MEPKKVLFEKILANISAKLKGMDTLSYERLVVSMIEYVLEDEQDEYKLYTFEELFNEFKKKEIGNFMLSQTVS